MQYGMTKVYNATVTEPQYDDNGNIVGEKEVVKSIKLVYNVLTLANYMNYTGRDLMADLTETCLKSAGTLKQIDRSKISDYLKKQIDDNDLSNVDFTRLTPEDMTELSKVNSSSSTMFLINFIASLMATARYPETVDFAELINEIPIEMLFDQKFVSELYEFMAFGLRESLKKNKSLSEVANKIPLKLKNSPQV